jgi:hypothetical protein
VSDRKGRPGRGGLFVFDSQTHCSTLDEQVARGENFELKVGAGSEARGAVSVGGSERL